jgi:hypothetical protein
VIRRILLVSLVVSCTPHAVTTGPVGPGAGGSGGGGTVANAPVNALVVGPPFATPGERMSYKLSLGGVEIAGFDLGVGEISEVAGKQAIEVQGHARALGVAAWVAKIDDSLTSFIDVTSGRPLRFVVDEKAAKTDAVEHTEAALATRVAGKLQITFNDDTDPPKTETQVTTQQDIWDFDSFLTAMRGWEGPVGSTVTCEVLRSRYLWHVQMTIAGKEKRVTPMGELPALRLDGVAYKLARDGHKVGDTDDRHFSLWISDDGDRVPLALVAVTDYGDVKMQITDYQPGTGTRLRP